MDSLLCGMFVREALELVQSLAERFGRLYPKFIVAWRLMSEISIDVISLSPSASSSLSSTANGGTRQNERALTRERDRALERGDKMCQGFGGDGGEDGGIFSYFGSEIRGVHGSVAMC